MTTAITPRTNGDRVQEILDRAGKRLTERAQLAREHPDEVLVAVLPMVIAWHLSLKYDMDFADHLLITQLASPLGALALKAYREWKDRPARPSLKEVA